MLLIAPATYEADKTEHSRWTNDSTSNRCRRKLNNIFAWLQNFRLLVVGFECNIEKFLYG